PLIRLLTTSTAAPRPGPASSPLPALFLCSSTRRPPNSTLFPYTTLFRSETGPRFPRESPSSVRSTPSSSTRTSKLTWSSASSQRSEEHTSELQSPYDLVCRLLLEKKKRLNTPKWTVLGY